ncbi:MAG: sigma-54-dependent Fis family transcriptional regulator, partial [Bacteroidetes bacterium]|nr:sigma-54-dependent Fis family transcriptional regulator [Bacteroidota bacterium]
EDLYYRIDVVTITLPPLRERREDIGPLSLEFTRKYAEINGKDVHSISREAMDVLQRYDYPGNVRELENIVQRAVVLTRGDIISTRDLPPDLTGEFSTQSTSFDELLQPGDLNARVEMLERLLIEKALKTSEGNQVRAAEQLGISERTLRYKLMKYRS